MLRRILVGGLWTVAWLLIVLGLAITIVPRFLDRIYYDGAAGPHFDGARFFNPDGEDTARLPGGGSRGGFIWRYLTGSDGRPDWPDRVAVTPGYGDPALVPCPRLSGGARVENWRRCNRSALTPGAMSATWIGHATVLVQTPGFAMLTDPIWADRAGPMGIGPRRVAAPGIAIADLPRIDLIVVSHNHYDHMDLAALKALWDRDRPQIITSLGNDAILRNAGIGDGAPERLIALDWNESLNQQASCADEGPACPSWAVHVTRNHHWGSRWGVDRNRALWSSFTVDTPSGRVFFAGDTGMGDGRWPGEAARIPGPPIRLAILPIGAFRFQPGQLGIGSHIGPPDAIRVWNRLGRPQTVGIHWGTFRLSSEAYATPPRMLSALMTCVGAPTPQRFTTWRIGRSHSVAPLVDGAGTAAPPIDEARINPCAQTPMVRALR
jgi:L-ascorbate metabolism protein UlaG (beta-lactamase superfamily)